MKSNNSTGKRLFEILELQREILEISLQEDNLEKYVRVRNTVSQFLQSLITISTEDFGRFKRIIDLRNYEEEELFNDIQSEDKQLYYDVTSSNKIIRFLIRFFLTGILNAYKTSDENKFKIFYIDLNKLLNEITSNKYVNHETKRNFFGEEYSSPNLKTKFFLDETISAYYDFISIGEGLNTIEITRQQSFIKFKILFEIHREYYFKDDFELTLTQETLNLIERIIQTQFIDKDDTTTFGWICSSLYSIADELHFRHDELKRKIVDKSQSELLRMIDAAYSVNTIDQFSEFDKQLGKVSSTDNYFSKEVRSLAVFSLKFALFRYMFIRIGASLIASKKFEMVYELLFSRQPLEADYINSNHDFFPTDVIEVTKILASQDKLSYTNFGRFERKQLNKQRDQFMVLWLFRNYLWGEQQQGYKYIFGLDGIEDGPDVERVQRLLTKFHDLIDEWKDSDLITFQKRVSPTTVEGFKIKLYDLKEKLMFNHLEKIKNESLIPEKVEQYRIKVVEILNKQKSLTNFFLGRLKKRFELSDVIITDGNIRNTQLYDKGPFIDKSLPLISSINADSVYPEVMGQNLSLQSDSYLFRKIKSYCDEEYLTLGELDEKLLSSNFKNKTVLSHYIHLGFELLKDEFNHSSVKGDNEGTFNDSEGMETKVYSFYSYSQLKFVMIFNDIKMKGLFDISEVQIEKKDYPEDRLQVLFEGVFNMTIKELKNKELGTIYYLR